MRWSWFFSIAIFVITLVAAIVERFVPTMPFLNILPTLLNDSTSFLTAICIIGIVVALLKNRDEKALAIGPSITYALDLILINKLYLNTTWLVVINEIPSIWATIKSWNWPIIFVTIFCFVVTIFLLVYGIQIWQKESKEKQHRIKTYDRQHSSDTTPLGDSNDTIHTEDESIHDAINQQEENIPLSSDLSNEGLKHDAPSMAYFWVCVLLIVPTISFIQFLFYEVLPLDLTVPTVLRDSLSILIYIGTICIGIVCCLLLWIAKRRTAGKGIELQVRLPAVLAFIVEIIIFCVFFFHANHINQDFLNSFLNTVTNNTLAAVIVIPIVMFVILDVGISMFINVFFGGIGGNSKKWTAQAEKKLDDIQYRVVMFVLNIIIGILNLFLFIPDFFNEIGEVLLGNGALFPEFEEYIEEHTESEPSNTLDESETPNEPKTP